MATVIDPVLYNALLQSKQGGLSRMTGGHRVYPTNGCCISGNTVGVYKDPIAILEVSDVTVCSYEPLSVDIDKSFSATSTLQTYSVDWGDGNVSNGAWPPAGSISHPAGGYLFPGVYTIILAVTDLLGATGIHAVDVNVEDCIYIVPIGYVPGYPVPDTLYDYHYVLCSSTNTANDYYTDDIENDPPTWGFFTTSNEKTVMMPSDTKPRLFGYGNGKIREYVDLYLGFPLGVWTDIMSEDDIADECGHLADYWDANVSRMVFSNRPTQEEWGWAIVYIYWTDGGGDEHFAVYVLHTRDAWSTVHYAVELFDMEEGVDWDWLRAAEVTNLGLAYDSHSSTVYALAGKCPESDGLGNPTYPGWWKLYRSQNFGFSYDVAQQDTIPWVSGSAENPTIDCAFFDIWAPWVSNTYNGGAVFWTCAIVNTTSNAFAVEWDTLIYRSLNHGLTATRIGDDGGLPQGVNVLKGPWNSLDRVFAGRCAYWGKGADQGEIWQWRDGMGWNLFRDVAPATYRDCYNMLIMEQDGYALKSALFIEDPYWVESASETSKLCTEEKVQWFTAVYT